MSQDRTVVARLIELAERLAERDPEEFRAFMSGIDEAQREVATMSTLALDGASE